VEADLPTFLIAPPGLSYDRAVAVARAVKQFGERLTAVVEECEQSIYGLADLVLPVCGQMPEPLVPLVYCSAVELFASDLAQDVGDRYLRAGTPSLKATPELIRGNQVANRLAELPLQAVTRPQRRAGLAAPTQARRIEAKTTAARLRSGRAAVNAYLGQTAPTSGDVDCRHRRRGRRRGRRRARNRRHRRRAHRDHPRAGVGLRPR
jgi:hypothetical protein